MILPSRYILVVAIIFSVFWKKIIEKLVFFAWRNMSKLFTGSKFKIRLSTPVPSGSKVKSVIISILWSLTIFQAEVLTTYHNTTSFPGLSSILKTTLTFPFLLTGTILETFHYPLANSTKASGKLSRKIMRGAKDRK